MLKLTEKRKKSSRDSNVFKMSISSRHIPRTYTVFDKQHFHKQHQAEIGDI